MLYGYIDRSDSSTGSSEKSQKVHSINYKIGVLLQKEVQSLNVEEKNVACSIAVNQRIQTTRFRNKLARSLELTKRHEKIRSRFTHEEARPNKIVNNRVRRQAGTYETKRYETDPDLKVNTEERRLKQENNKMVKSKNEQFSFQTFADFGASKNRPQTALETKSKQWNKNAETAKERVVRAKSAPAKSWRSCSEIMSILNNRGGAFYVANKQERPLSRAKFVEIFDMESFREFRKEEVAREKCKVNALVESFEPLKLETWYPGPGPLQETQREIHKATKKKDVNKFSSFITRVDSIL